MVAWTVKFKKLIVEVYISNIIIENSIQDIVLGRKDLEFFLSFFFLAKETAG